MVYDLENWPVPQEKELVRTGVRNYRPEYHTGITVQCFGGWEWMTEEGVRYRTNSEGDGLWRWLPGRSEWSQVTGTRQFSLSPERQKALRELSKYGLAPRKL